MRSFDRGQMKGFDIISDLIYSILHIAFYLVVVHIDYSI